jgi:ParB family transcriptional regulator, chromosome partitioning protein
MTGRIALTSSESFEAYSPWHISDAARYVMGGIDLDPASCAQANDVVNADRFYDVASNGLLRPWERRVFLNWPGGKEKEHGTSALRWANKLVVEITEGRTVEAFVVLFRWDHSSAWWRLLAMRRPNVCLLHDRLHFWGPGGGDSPVHASAVAYYGDHEDRFVERFGPLGDIWFGSGLRPCAR